MHHTDTAHLRLGATIIPRVASCYRLWNTVMGEEEPKMEFILKNRIEDSSYFWTPHNQGGIARVRLEN